MQDKQRNRSGLAHQDSLIAGTAQVRLHFSVVACQCADGSQLS